MKNFLILIFIFVSTLFPVKNTKIFAEQIYFGRALSTNIYLYSSPKVYNDKSNAVFQIPTTYFVKLISEENDLFYKAQYNGIYGYVLKNEVSCINKTPINPFLNNVSFRIFTPSGANLRTSPNESIGASNLITTIPFMNTNLVYYGIIEGEEAISYKGNIWYYCKYIKENQAFFGYVYSPLCDLLTNYPQNVEEFTYITPDFSKNQNDLSNEEKYFNMSNPWQIIIVVLITLPCLIILYFLFKPTKIATQKPAKIKQPPKPKPKKKKISRLKHSDYYELDSDYFN